MQLIVHISTFIFAALIIWFFAGMLIQSIDRVANRFHRSSFTVAFFILGVLTSISEISVATNATIDRMPQISAGNLVGASFVIPFFIIASLAIVGKGIELRHTLSRNNLIFSLLVIILPVILAIDGNVTIWEGLLAFMAYVTLIAAIRRQREDVLTQDEAEKITESFIGARATWIDGIKIAVGAGFIFLSGHFLVEESVYFANMLSVPSSVIGILLLSIGTNIPELAVAARSIFSGKKDIAFGNYIGSAVANTLIFSMLPIVNGSFTTESSGFLITAVLMAVGFIFFYFFAKSHHFISRKEGFVLMLFYVAFLTLQLRNIAQLSG